MLPLVFSVLGAGLFYKIGQAITDEEYAGVTVPTHIRERKLLEHTNLYGYYCPRCSKRTYDLEIDHIIPLACGGRNSWYNLQVLCKNCNRTKGATYTVLESFRGRQS